MSGSPSRQCPAAMSRVDDVAELGGGDLGRRRRPGRAGPRPAAASTTCGPAPARRPASTASPGSSARSPSPARSSGRTAAPGWSPRPAAASCSHRQPAGSARRPSAGSGSPASARRSRAILDLPAVHRVVDAPCPRRHSGSSDSSASMCTRSGRHSTASHGLEQRVPARAQAAVQLAAEPRQPATALVLHRTRPGGPHPRPGHTESHGHRLHRRFPLDRNRRCRGGRPLSRRHATQHGQTQRTSTSEVKQQA